MPLNTEIHRDGEPLKIRWGYWHVNVMYTAAMLEQDREYKLNDDGDTVANVGMWSMPEDEKDKPGWEILPEHDGEFQIIIDFKFGVYYLESKCDLCTKGEQTLKQEHRFLDPADGEILVLKPGDVLSAYRSHKS